MRLPVCRGCESDIDSVTKPGASWLVTVTSPDGAVGTPQPFCLSCMLRLFALGVSQELPRSGAV